MRPQPRGEHGAIAAARRLDASVSGFRTNIFLAGSSTSERMRAARILINCHRHFRANLEGDESKGKGSKHDNLGHGRFPSLHPAHRSFFGACDY